MKFLNLRGPSIQGKKLFFPLISILAVVLTLIILLSISTYRHLNRGQQRMEESLFRDGQIILKSFETFFRTGMMGMMGQTANLQEILNSVAALADIRFVALLDQQGSILAHNDERLVGTTFEQKEKLAQRIGTEGTKSWFEEKEGFIVAKKMEPFSYRGMGEGRADGMGFRMHSMMTPRETLFDRVLSGQIYAVVGLETKTFEEARSSDLRHALLMAVILLILGTAGLYFIFLVQNYYTTQRALDSITLYMNQVVENMPDGLLSLNPQGKIITLNNRAKEILAIKGQWPSEKEEIQKQFLPSIAPILKALEGKSPVLEHEVEFPLKEGKFIPLSLSAARLISETEEDLGAVILLRDLREIKDLQEKIKRSERLASLGTLAAGMAHEIRNPLSSIKGFAQYFLKKNPPGSEGQKYSRVIIQEVERLNRVITNLLDFARPQDPVMSPVSIGAILHHTLELIKEDARSKGIQVRTDIPEHLPLLLMDRDQITQVLLNILLNGLDVLKESGSLSIRALLNPERKVLIVEIEDNGPGMSGEEISKIFDPFFTTKRAGIGLGLAIAYRIMEKHQGTLMVQSKPGEGSIFHLELPVGTEETNE